MWFDGIPSECRDLELPCYVQKRLNETQEKAKKKIAKIRKLIADYENCDLDKVEHEIDLLLKEINKSEKFRESTLPAEETRFQKIRNFLLKHKLGVFSK